LIAHAQAEAPASDGGKSMRLEEIVVTAQRREQNLSNTPVAVAVLGAESLRDHAIISEEDLRSAVPGLNVKASFNSNDLNYVIRGQSVDTMSNTRPGVLPYINEVQIGGAGAVSTFYDLQSVQVLKGPQGTLFGRSATGGAVLFTTQKPTDEFEGYVTAGGGNYGQQKYEGAINVPSLAPVRPRQEHLLRTIGTQVNVSIVRETSCRGPATCIDRSQKQIPITTPMKSRTARSPEEGRGMSRTPASP
jgi:outer membrane receptor protein involved in Fe transport